MLTFIETKRFTRLADEYLPGDELARLQHHLTENPEAGEIIRGSVAYGSCGGVHLDAGSVVGFGSSTT